MRKTQERIATLGVFSSIQVALSEPYVPQASKDVIVDVVERPGQYIELSPGFSTGEGVRGTLEYGERNIFGYAIGATFRVQLSLPARLSHPRSAGRGQLRAGPGPRSPAASR